MYSVYRVYFVQGNRGMNWGGGCVPKKELLSPWEKIFGGDCVHFPDGEGGGGNVGNAGTYWHQRLIGSLLVLRRTLGKIG